MSDDLQLLEDAKMINPCENASQPHQLIAFDINIGVSPAIVYKVLSGDLREGAEIALAKLLTEKLNLAAETLISGTTPEWTLQPIRVEVNSRTDLSYTTETERRERALQELSDLGQELSKEFQQSRTQREHEVANNPDNGKMGIWRVEGMRHGVLIKADHARKAIEEAIALEMVGEWEREFITVEFLVEISELQSGASWALSI